MLSLWMEKSWLSTEGFLLDIIWINTSSILDENLMRYLFALAHVTVPEKVPRKEGCLLEADSFAFTNHGIQEFGIELFAAWDVMTFRDQIVTTETVSVFFSLNYGYLRFIFTRFFFLFQFMMKRRNQSAIIIDLLSNELLSKVP